MNSRVINQELREATERKGITQVKLARGTFRAKTTLNGYFRGEPTPVDAMKDIANYMNDSLFSQEMSFRVFKQIPPMQSDVFQDSPHTLDMIELFETGERQIRKNKAMMALAKREAAMTEEDKEAINDYVMNYLDEIFIETRCVESILERINLSLMDAVIKRTPYWRKQNYLRGE
ncbi:hypothetical protein SAMN04488102_101333 [Alkalibacterium subtropicum]|uniref:Uncharacterized protein n=1 Tax=Alkalibacterium subtropicum TaxID=753702 RepID=A0A1I1EYT3_9LACT|nr:helix-turn-helix transcriptional regulator [Alkalibacterium subtropicum]SFB90090.1 hypothetical protein SAMN04488102_101333 [Alkalibacterium subtropicum]